MVLWDLLMFLEKIQVIFPFSGIKQVQSCRDMSFQEEMFFLQKNYFHFPFHLVTYIKVDAEKKLVEKFNCGFYFFREKQSVIYGLIYIFKYVSC